MTVKASRRKTNPILPFAKTIAASIRERRPWERTKALGEEVLAAESRSYIWRMRIPFDNQSHPRNYLQKLMTYERLLEAENSLSHLDEFVQACLDSVQRQIPDGIYNLTNPGSVRTSEITKLIEEYGLVAKSFSFFRDEEEFMRVAAKTPRSNCVLDATKALQAGLNLSPIEDVLRRSLAAWEPAHCTVANA